MSPLQLAAVGYESQPSLYNFTHREVILYALGVGVSTRDEHALRFLFEGNDNFSALPTFGVIPGFGGFGELVSGGVPGLEIELAKVL